MIQHSVTQYSGVQWLPAALQHWDANLKSGILSQGHCRRRQTCSAHSGSRSFPRWQKVHVYRLRGQHVIKLTLQPHRHITHIHTHHQIRQTPLTVRTGPVHQHLMCCHTMLHCDYLSKHLVLLPRCCSMCSKERWPKVRHSLQRRLCLHPVRAACSLGGHKDSSKAC
jgi:hypothetical protein